VQPSQGNREVLLPSKVTSQASKETEILLPWSPHLSEEIYIPQTEKKRSSSRTGVEPGSSSVESRTDASWTDA